MRRVNWNGLKVPVVVPVIKKGDRVECTIKGVLKYGVVVKGGKVITVILDGGVYEVKGQASAFSLSDHPLLKDDPSIMDKYSVHGYKEIAGHGDSPTFQAKIYKDGKPFLNVSNDGWGGNNDYGYGAGVEEFYNDAKAWALSNGDAELIDPNDDWVYWYQFKRPYGVTSKMYIAEFEDFRSSKCEEIKNDTEEIKNDTFDKLYTMNVKKNLESLGGL